MMQPLQPIGGHRGLASVFLLSLATGATVAWSDIPDTPSLRWELLRLGGTDLGYGQVQQRWESRNGQRVLATTSETHLQVKRFGQVVSQSLRLTCHESEDGELLDYSSDVGSGKTSVKTVGQVRGDALELTIESAGRQSRQVIPWQADFGSPFAVEHSLMRQPPREGETRRFQMILPVYNQLAEVTLTAKSKSKVDCLGKERVLREIVNRTELSSSQTLVSRLWIDDDGQIIKTLVEGLGQETFRVARERALAAAGSRFDIGKFSSVPLAYSGNLLAADSITYRVRIADGDAEGLFISDARQLIRPAGNGELLIMIGANQGGRTSRRYSNDDLSSNTLIQSGDARVVRLAAKAAGGEQDKEKLARKLTRFVHANMRIREASEAMASAAEVAETMEGDCTEHAMLLVALCRSRGIPARVALGLVYSTQLRGFGYHMWTEAWVDNDWISLDATRRDGSVGPGHLKMSVSSLKGVSPYEAFLPILSAMGRLQIDVVQP